MNNLLNVKDSLKAVTPEGHEILLIAVSKTQPIEAIKSVYSLGHRDFGENYIQELSEKAAALKEDCPDIKWHFIGALQSNKIPQLIRIGRGLKAIQTVDSLSKFDKIWKAIHNNSELFADTIDLFLQVIKVHMNDVNISGEESKHGLKGKEEIIQIYRHYLELKQRESNSIRCNLKGLMIIGEIEESERDFSKMIQLRAELAAEIGWIDCKLSMGMSGDYGIAAKMGSDIVRIGTAIFGARNK